MTKERKPRKTKEDSSDEGDDSPSVTAALLSLVEKITDLVANNSSLQQELKSLKDDHKKLQDNYNELLSRVESLEKNSDDWSAVPSRRQHSTTGDLEALTCTVADELEARKEKQANVVIYGLPELPPGTDDEQPSEDAEKDSVSTLLKDDLGIQNPDVVRAYRMGRPRTDRKPRPIKVHLPDTTHKKTVLENAKKLGRLPEEHEHYHVFIRSDWTAMQREQDYRRRQELRAQRGNDRDSNEPSSPRNLRSRPSRR